MALAWIHNGVNQFFGHYIPQRRECYAWGIVDYFVVMQGRFTYAESVYLHRVSAMFKQKKSLCCHGTVFYGDPAWEARVSKEVEPPYEQSIKLEKKDNAINIAIKIDFKQDYKSEQAVAFLLDEFIKNAKITYQSNDKLSILILDNLIMVDCGERKKNDTIEIRIAAEPLIK